MKGPAISNGIQEYCLESWQEFHELSEDVFSKAPAYIYRGQTDHNWRLQSSLDRLEERHPKRRNLSGKTPEWFDCPPFSGQEHLNAFMRAVRGRLDLNSWPLANEDEWWALGQHHGLATPLLDWTRSPYIALFFAFEEDSFLVADGTWAKPEHRAVYALSTSTIEDTAGKDEDHVSLVSPGGDTHYRLISQAGLLVKMPRHTDLETYVKKRFAHKTGGAILTKVKIPNVERLKCLVALNKMNINHMSLFPDVDGAAKHVNSLWQPGHEDSIAYV